MKRALFSNWIAAVLPVALVCLAAGESRAQRPSMELLETKQSATQTTIDIVGQVKNIGTREVMGVTVYCDFQDAAGKSVRVVEGHLDTDPLAPNKISTFKISTRSSPEIKRFNLTFPQIFSSKLVTKDSRKP